MTSGRFGLGEWVKRTPRFMGALLIPVVLVVVPFMLLVGLVESLRTAHTWRERAPLLVMLGVLALGTFWVLRPTRDRSQLCAASLATLANAYARAYERNDSADMSRVLAGAASANLILPRPCLDVAIQCHQPAALHVATNDGRRFPCSVALRQCVSDQMAAGPFCPTS